MKELEDNLIFVVDDNEMQSMMMDYVLSKEKPYKVVRFKSGEECLANLNRNPVRGPGVSRAGSPAPTGERRKAGIRAAAELRGTGGCRWQSG